MNIKPEFTTPERPNAIEAMDHAMDYLFSNFIEPKKNELTETDADIICQIGIIFKDMAEKAEAYYQNQEGIFNGDQNSLN